MNNKGQETLLPGDWERQRERLRVLEASLADLQRHNESLSRQLQEKERGDAALVSERTQLRTLIDALPDHIYFKDAQGRIVTCNLAEARHQGKTLEQLVGKSDFDFYPFELASHFAADERALMESGQPLLNHEEPNVDLAGNQRWYSTTKVPMRDASGKVNGLVGITRDVTDRKQAEEELKRAKEAAETVNRDLAQANDALQREIQERQRADEALASERTQLRTLIDALPDHIYFKDAQGRIVTCNLAEARHQGKTLEQLVGKSDFDFYPFELASQFAADERALMESGQPLLNHEEPNVDLEGHQRWYSTTKVPMRDASGNVTGLVGITRDVTARKQAEEELKRAKDAAETANRAKSEFLANMSHEIRTPMNAVIGMSNLLLDTPLNPEQREFIEIVSSSGEALLTIINDILDFSKIEAGKLCMEMVDFNLPDTVESAVDLVAERAQAKGIELTYLIARDVPSELRGDPGRLRQILLNLLSNAVKFTEKGEVALDITRVADGENHSELHFSIRDTGIGISAPAQARLFQPFEQEDGSTTRRYGGTGLGLAICRRLVDLMDGQIGVVSQSGQGSTFWFRLKLAKPSALSAGAPPSTDQVHFGRVLVVDDNETNRTILRYQMQNWRLDHMAGVASGPEALAVLREAARAGKPFDLVILDMQMPDMDGLAVAREIKADRLLANTCLVMLTSICQRINSIQLESTGIAACLVKPVKPTQLLRCLSRVMAERQGTISPKTSLAELPAASPKTVSLKLLLAEDNAVNQRVAIRQLQRLGHTVDTVANGLEAVEAVRRIHYDVIILDCVMPEMDGFEAARRIRELPASHRTGQNRVPIIAMTANAMHGDREKCLEAGMDDYISKPVRMDELKAILEKHAPKKTDNIAT